MVMLVYFKYLISTTESRLVVDDVVIYKKLHLDGGEDTKDHLVEVIVTLTD